MKCSGMADAQKPQVTTEEGIRYGLGLLGYAFIVVIVGLGLAWVGWSIVGPGVAGAVLVLVGVVIFYAGILGLGYKVIADGVAAGMIMAGSQ